MAIVYLHKRKKNSEVFYIGIGKVNDRAYSKRMRNRHWQFIVNKDGGFDVEIIFENISYEEAYIKEKELIKSYGRKDLGLGNLVNFTDGGEGLVNPNSESRLRISEANKRPKPWSEERKTNYTPPNKNKKGLQVGWNKGLKIPCTDERKRKLSEKMRGIKKKPFTDEHKKNLKFKKPKVCCMLCHKEMTIQNIKRHRHDIGKCKKELAKSKQ